MYQNDYSFTVSQNSEVLREDGSNVTINENQAYEMRLKNKSDNSCLVNVEIDGKDVTGAAIYLQPGSYVDMKGIVKGDFKEILYTNFERSFLKQITSSKEVEKIEVKAIFTPIKNGTTFKPQACSLNQPYQVEEIKWPNDDTFKVHPLFQWMVPNISLTFPSFTGDNPFTGNSPFKWFEQKNDFYIGNYTDELNKIKSKSDKVELKLTLLVNKAEKKCTCGYEWRTEDKFCSQCGKKRK